MSFGNVKRSLPSRNPSRVMGICCDCDMKRLRYQQSFTGKLINSESDIGSNLLMTDLRRPGLPSIREIRTARRGGGPRTDYRTALKRGRASRRTILLPRPSLKVRLQSPQAGFSPNPQSTWQSTNVSVADRRRRQIHRRCHPRNESGQNSTILRGSVPPRN